MEIHLKRKIGMRWSLASDDLAALTARQLGLFAASPKGVAKARLAPYMRDARQRVETCFQGIRKKYYFDGENALFDHLHGDHYAIYLYYLSNTVHAGGKDEELASHLFRLNKALHGADLFYAVKLPPIFLVVHPVGTVLGNGVYGNYFVAYQNCGIGSLEDGKYPVLAGENVLFARAAVLGACQIGRNVVLGANAFLLNTAVPDNRTVVGAYPNHRILPNPSRVIERMFR